MSVQKLFFHAVLLWYFLYQGSWLCPAQVLSLESQNRNSERIVFSSFLEDSWQIWSVDSNGKHLSQLTKTRNNFHYPSISTDGKRITFVGNDRTIWFLKNGRAYQRIENIPPNSNHPSWSPLGDKIVFVAYTFENRKEDSDIWIYDINRGSVNKLMQQDNIQSFPTWSPDGKTLVYTSGYRVDSTNIHESLWMVDSDGKNPRPLISDNFYSIQPSWSPDGKTIAYASNKSGNMDIWVVGKDGTNLKQVTFDKSYDADPCWSPDGSKICFTSTRSGQMEIWIMDKDGRNEKQLTGFSGSKNESMHPCWN